jgi:hypothetical protein
LRHIIRRITLSASRVPDYCEFVTYSSSASPPLFFLYDQLAAAARKGGEHRLDLGDIDLQQRTLQALTTRLGPR